MQQFNGRKDFAILSDYDLSQQLNQLIEWANLSENAKQMLATVSKRMEYADHTAPLASQSDLVAIHTHTFEVVQDRTFMHSLEGALNDAFRLRICEDHTIGNFANKVVSMVDYHRGLDFSHKGPYCANFGVVISYAMIQHTEDFSDFRVVCFSKTDHGRASAIMINRGDAYPFSILFDGEPRNLTPSDLLFWRYNDVYRQVIIDTVHNTITTQVHRYSTGKTEQHLHEIKAESK
jgi:hypothetical protein